MRGFEESVEERIRAAMAAGEFNNLPGAGKPLNLQDNPHEPEGWGMAFRLLKNNNVTLPWLEERQEIERELEEARAAAFCSQEPNARITFQSRLEHLNRRILSYNLRVPRPVFQRGLIAVQAEIEAAFPTSPQDS